jgi:NAD(P)-dependent dehydrogenase (short-subunit alcohol dehydrogenase family)
MNIDKAKYHSIIVGGSSGIGRELVVHLSKTDNVSVMARREDKLNELSKDNDNVFALTSDVSSVDSIRNSLQACIEHYGKVDRLIYCAGKQIVKPHRMADIKDFDSLYEVNLRGALFVSKLFSSAKISEKTAVFCAISSIAATRPEPGIVGYSAMKAALEAMIKGLAKEVGPRRFVGVAPGWLETEMTAAQLVYGKSFKETLEKNSPLGLTDIKDVINAVDFLISPRAASITGQILCVDSGSSL